MTKARAWLTRDTIGVPLDANYGIYFHKPAKAKVYYMGYWQMPDVAICDNIWEREFPACKLRPGEGAVELIGLDKVRIKKAVKCGEK